MASCLVLKRVRLSAAYTEKCNARKLGVVLVGRVTRDGRVVFCLGPMKMMIHLPVPL